ncbi:MAG: hypothetical protein ACXWKP_20535 [Bradyrhizobium sp.]
MQIAWCAAVDEPALMTRATDPNAARDQAITLAHVAADLLGGALGRGIQSD